MLRYTFRMTGLAGAPYFSTFYTNGNAPADAAAAVPHMHTFWTALAGLITNGLTIALEPEVDSLLPETGQVVNTFSGGVFTNIVTGGNAPLPKATQGLLRLRTGGFVAGRRVNGRVFIPALANDAQLGGVPSTAFLTTVAGAAEDLRTDLAATASEWVVWSRPKDADDSGPARAGSAHLIESVSVWTQFAVLRSRRD